MSSQMTASFPLALASLYTHTAAQIADELPADFVSNSLVTKADYISALAQAGAALEEPRYVAAAARASALA